MLIAVLIVAFVVSLNMQRQRALQAEAHAEREAQSANRSREFLVSLFQEAAPENTLGRSVTVRELIDKGSQRIEAELKDEPESAARLGATVAEVYGSLGDPKAAIDRGEKALALAAGDTAEHALMRAEILQVLGSAYDDTERFDDAKHAVEQALELRQRYAPDDVLNIARAYSDVGGAAVRRGDHDAARSQLRARARRIREIAERRSGREQATCCAASPTSTSKTAKTPRPSPTRSEALDMIAAMPPLAPDRMALWTTLARAQVADGDPGGGGCADTCAGCRACIDRSERHQSFHHRKRPRRRAQCTRPISRGDPAHGSGHRDRRKTAARRTHARRRTR